MIFRISNGKLPVTCEGNARGLRVQADELDSGESWYLQSSLDLGTTPE